MIRRLFTLIYKAKSIAGVSISLFDFAELFNRVWSNHELIIVIAAVVIIPVLKLSVFLYDSFGIRIPFGLPKRYSKFLLRFIYWTTVVASAFNFTCKCSHDGDMNKLFAWGILYIVILVMDFIETEETIHKIEEQQQG